MEYVTWNLLGTYAGALAMIMVITQLTKDIALLKRLPTQLWSYMIALAILYLAEYFLGQLTLECAILVPFNAAILALGANGGYAAVTKITKRD